MSERNAIETAKNAAIMTAKGAVKGTEATLVVGTAAAKEARKYLVEGVNGDENTNIPDIKDVDDKFRDRAIEQFKKSADKHNEARKDYKRELKSEKKDYKKIQKDLRKEHGLDKKQLKAEKQRFKDKKHIYENSKGMLTDRETNFLCLVYKDENKQKLKKAKNAERIKAVKRQGAVAALNAKKEFKNDIRSGSSLSSDNLRESGKKSLVGAVHKGLNKLFNPLERIKRRLMMWISSIIGQLVTFLLPYIACLVVIVAVVAAFANIGSNILSFFGLGGDDSPNSVVTVDDHVGFTDDQIESLIQERKDLGEVTPEQEKLLRFAFGLVGEEYVYGAKGTAKDDNGNEIVAYDCSGFAYYAEKEMGNSIAYDCAAVQCEKLSEANKVLGDTSSEPQIGDLIYARRPNSDACKDRWNQVGHVYVYVGNGYVVHASSSSRGIVYEKVKPNDVFMICRP